MSTHADQLRQIKRLDQLVAYLRDELSWPVSGDGIEDITYDYSSDELGLETEHAAKIKEIKQLRPLTGGQPWGIFWVNFEKRRLPIVVLRRILANLVIKSRAGAKSADRPRWQANDLLFISAYGDEETDQREIAFAHFHQTDGDLPTLKVLGWDGADTALKLDHVASTLETKLRWPTSPKDVDAWRLQWSGAFRHRLGHIIRTSDMLAERLAVLARGIHDRCLVIMRAESELGSLTKLYKAFQAALIHDLSPETFADAYAQTITYGLLTAAINRTDMSGGTEATYVKADDITLMVRSTSPFLKEMLETFLHAGGRKNGVNFDELGIQDVVELLRGDETDLPAILRDFGNRTRGEDPVIHFYEHFLSAYNKKLKIQRGIFYTPQPVVSYIVRSVHELLQTEFGLEEGLASTVTWGEMVKKHPGLRLPPISEEPGDTRTVSADEPFVQILDPATGTATFLVETVEVIYQAMSAKWKKQGRLELEIPKLWNEYVPKHLLPRLHGYELLAAPYAIAHLKLGLKLTETGYRFGSAERARIYLTNALEPKVRQLPQIGFEPLAHEAQAVNEIKWYKRFTVVIGNPPYSVSSQNDGPWIVSMCDDFKAGLEDERNIQPLSDDYIKFLRFGLFQLESTRTGMVAMITNREYIQGVIHRSIRRRMLAAASGIQITDLHGQRGELIPGGRNDENVFQIEKGVAIGIFLFGSSDVHTVRFGEIIGMEPEKASVLRNSLSSNLAKQTLTPSPPQFFLKPWNTDFSSEYQSIPSLLDYFQKKAVTGFATHRDHFAIDFSKEALNARLERFLDPAVSDDAIRNEFELGDTRDWQLHESRIRARRDKSIFERIRLCTYRPFDNRWVIYSDDVLEYSRRDAMQHVSATHPALICSRIVKDEAYAHAFISEYPVEKIFLSPKSSNNAQVFLTGESVDAVGKLLSFGSAMLLPIKGEGLDPKSHELLSYIYAVLYSPGYRSRYAEFLKIDFPHLPLTGNMDLFHKLAGIGSELVALHLLESSKLDHPMTEYIGGRAPEVEKVSWSKNTVWLDKEQTSGFKGVRQDVWNFHVGGYQVCEKWLKDRKGRTLTAEDRTHYQKIIVALSETIRLMSEINQAIEKAGGWPLK